MGEQGEARPPGENWEAQGMLVGRGGGGGGGAMEGGAGGRAKPPGVGGEPEKWRTKKGEEGQEAKKKKVTKD